MQMFDGHGSASILRAIKCSTRSRLFCPFDFLTNSSGAGYVEGTGLASFSAGSVLAAVLVAAAAGVCKAECTNCVDCSRLDVGVGCARSGVEFFGEILPGTLATREIAWPLKNVSFVCFLSGSCLDGLWNDCQVGHWRTCQLSSVQSRRAAPRDGNGSDRRRNKSYIERIGQFL